MATPTATAKITKMAQRNQQKAQSMANDDSDDEAPEVVTKASAQEQALDQLRHEKEAKDLAAAAASAKRSKRKTRAEVTEATETPKAQEQEEETADAPELSVHVLSAIATRDEEDLADQELDEAREQQRRKRAAAATKRTHIRDFGTVKVQTLASLDAAECRAITESADAFLARKAAPQRPRVNVLEGHASQFTKKQKRRA